MHPPSLEHLIGNIRSTVTLKKGTYVTSFKYLIVGGGMTADAAVHGIREVDSSGSIGIIASEPHPPYSRPPLSKALWKGVEVDSIWRKTEERGVTIFSSRTVQELSPREQRVTDHTGEEYAFENFWYAKSLLLVPRGRRGVTILFNKL